MSGDAAPRRIDARGMAAADVDLGLVVEHLRGGGLLAHPTETVYGFGCLVSSEALERLDGLKRREAGRPVLLLVPETGAVEGLSWTHEARELARVFWPGSVTLLLRDPEGRFPPGVRSAEGVVGVRRTAHPLTARLVETLAEPMTSTSANAPGAPPARSGEEALEVARALGAGEELWILDAGALPSSAASTIVDCTGETPRVIRAGATPVRRLRCLLPEIDESPGA